MYKYKTQKIVVPEYLCPVCILEPFIRFAIKFDTEINSILGRKIGYILSRKKVNRRFNPGMFSNRDIEIIIIIVIVII